MGHRTGLSMAVLLTPYGRPLHAILTVAPDSPEPVVCLMIGLTHHQAFPKAIAPNE